MMKTLITYSNYDDATSYLSQYVKEIIDFANEKGISIIQLSKPRLRKTNVKRILEKQEISFIMFNAHGDDKTIYGDKIKGKEEALIREGENHNLLKGKLTYARACCAAASLGKRCTKEKGCFIGYSAPFSFWVDESWSANPLKDKTARLYLEPSNHIAISILKGKTAKQAVERFVAESKKNLQMILKKKKEPGAMVKAMVLWNNMQAQEILGNQDMKIST